MITSKWITQMSLNWGMVKPTLIPLYNGTIFSDTKEKLLIPLPAWVNLKWIMLHEKNSDSKGYILYNCICYCGVCLDVEKGSKRDLDIGLTKQGSMSLLASPGSYIPLHARGPQHCALTWGLMFFPSFPPPVPWRPVSLTVGWTLSKTHESWGSWSVILKKYLVYPKHKLI